MAVTSPPRIELAPSFDFASGRDLLLNLVSAELTARYKTAAFGMLWFLLSPLVLAAILATVFQSLIHLPIDRYPIFLLAALLPWTFFQTGLSNATVSVTRAQALVKRVRVPRMLLPCSAVIASLVHFLVALALLLTVLLVMGRAPGVGPLLMLLALVVVQVCCVVGLGLATASLNVIFRDIEHVVAMLLRFGFWLTPIFYPLDYVPARWRGVASLNPLTGLLEGYRAILLHDSLPPAGPLLFASVVSAALLVVGIVTFMRLDPHFDDHV